MKKTWIVVGSLFTVVTIGWTATQAVGLLAHEEVTESQTFGADGIDRLMVDNSSGTIEVQGDPAADEISVVAEISHGLQRTRHSAEVVDGALVLKSSCPWFSTWCSVDYRVTVPAAMSVSADSDNGRVTIRDITGMAQVSSDNGRVELVRVTGDVLASSNNGRIIGAGLQSGSAIADSDNGRIELTFATSPQVVTASSNNGRIEIVVPDNDDTYAVTAETDNGSTDIGIRTDPASSRIIDADADNGSVVIRYPAG